MKLGTMKDRLAGSLTGADEVFCYRGKDVSWDPAMALAPLGKKAQTFSGDLNPLVEALVKEAHEGDVILTMSNGGFGGICTKLLDALSKKSI